VPKDADAEIQRLLEKLNGKGSHEAEATFLLAQKLGHIENSLISLNESMSSIQQTLAAILEKTNLPSELRTSLGGVEGKLRPEKPGALPRR